jgi:excisionase family DNA binding protein
MERLENLEKLLLRPREVCHVTGFGKSKVYELIAGGDMPSVRIGKSVRVPADRLRQWIAELQPSKSKTVAEPRINRRSNGK